MISFANNHIVNKVRFALSDKTDSTFPFEDKLNMISDSLAEYNKAIFALRTVDLTSTDGVSYTLPTDFRTLFKVRLKTLVIGNYNPTNYYINTYLDENVDYIITNGTIRLMNPVHYPSVDPVTITSTIELVYEFAQEGLYFENLSAGYSLGSNVSVLVADSNKYDIGEYILIKGTTEQVVKVEAKADTTHITVDLLANIVSGDSIVGNLKIPAEDVNIVLHYIRYINQVQTSGKVTNESWGQGGRSYSVSYNTSSGDSSKGVLGEFYNMLEKHPNYRSKTYKGVSIFNSVKE